MVKIDKENSLFITGVVIANGVADSDGDVLTKKEIKQLNSSYLSQNTDTNHDFLENYGVKIIENYISKVDETIGGKTVPSGSWICKMVIWDEKIKEQIRQGRINGLSLASQPDEDVVSHEDTLNKRNTYSQFKNMDQLTPTFISLVKNPANGFDLDYYSYKTYVTKNKLETEVKSVENEDNAMGNLANKLLDALLKEKENKTEKEHLEEVVTKAAPPQGGVAPMQQPHPGYGQQPVSLEQVNQKLDQILSIIGGGQQPMKSVETDGDTEVSKKKKSSCKSDDETNSDEEVVEKEEKTNDESLEPETEGTDSKVDSSKSPDGKSDVKPSTETEGSVPSSGKKKKVLKSEDPKTARVENVIKNEKPLTYENPNATKRDLMGRPIRN